MAETIKFKKRKYTLRKKLGEGVYGEVWLATSKKGDEIVVKKVFLVPTDGVTDYAPTRKGARYTHPTDFSRETKLAKKVTDAGCPTLIKYLGRVKGPGNTRYILMEYFRGYTIQDWFECSYKTNYKLTPDQFLRMAKHLFQGLACMHSLGIAHIDLHRRNVMFNKKEMKIVDFGQLCTTYSGPLSCFGDTSAATIHYWEDKAKFRGGIMPDREDYPFLYDVRGLAEILKVVAPPGMSPEMLELIREVGSSYTRPDDGFDEIRKWLNGLIPTEEEGYKHVVSAQEALDDLNKIRAKSKYFY